MIIAPCGSRPALLERLPLGKIQAAKAFWSTDARGGWPSERAWQDQFDKLFISHSPCLKFFDETKAHWLPSGFIRLGQSQLIQFLSRPMAACENQANVVFPRSDDPAGARQGLPPALRRACAKFGQNVHSGPFESDLSLLQAIRNSRVVLDVGHGLETVCFETWALNRVLLTRRTPDHARIAFPQDSTFLFDYGPGNLEEQLAQALERSRHPVPSSGFVLNHHLLAHRILEILNVCFGQNCRLPLIQIPAPATGLSAAPAGPAPVPRTPPGPIVPENTPTPGGSRGNVGVMILASSTVPAAPELYPTRLQIEDNIGEAIHIHWRELRLDFSVRDFLALADACQTALERLEHKPIQLNPQRSNQVHLPPSFVRNLGAFQDKIIGTEITEEYLDDLNAIVYFAAGGSTGFKPKPISQSAPYLALESVAGEAAYSEYQRQFSTCGHSLEHFRQLVESMLRHGYPAHDEFIVLFGDEPFIRDGQHRAAVLRYYLGNAKVPVVRLHFESGFEGWRVHLERVRVAAGGQSTSAGPKGRALAGWLVPQPTDPKLIRSCKKRVQEVRRFFGAHRSP